MFHRKRVRNPKRFIIEQLEERQCLTGMPLLWMEDNSFRSGDLLPDDFIKRFQDPETWQVALRTIDTHYLKEDALRNTANNVTTAVLRDTIAPVLNASQANVAIDTDAANFLQRNTLGDSTAIDRELQSHLAWLTSLVTSGLRVQTISLRGVMSDTVPGDRAWSNYSLNERMADVVEYTRRVHQLYPWIQVGIIDASPANGLAYTSIYSSLQAFMNRASMSLDHIHLDMPVNLIDGTSFTWQNVFQIQRYVQTSVQSKFGLMLTSAEGGEFSNHRWAQRIMGGLFEYQATIRSLSTAETQPDRIIVTSQYTYPNTSVPELVPAPLVDGLGDLRLRNTSQSVIQLSNMLRGYDDFPDSSLQRELIHVFPVAAEASSTTASTAAARRTAVDAVFARGIVDAVDSTAQFQWQASAGDTTPWLKAILSKRTGIDTVRLWPFRGATGTEGGGIADVYVSRLQQAASNAADNPLTNPGNWALVNTIDMRGSSDNYVDARFSLVQTPAIAIVFRSAQGQAGLAALRVYAPVPGWINPYQSPLAASLPTVDMQAYFVVEKLASQPVADLFVSGNSAAQNYILTVSDSRFVLSNNRLSLSSSTLLDATVTPSVAVWVKLQSRANSGLVFHKLVTFIVYPQGASPFAADRGDLPASFESNDPAIHRISGLKLGQAVDADNIAQSSINADADDRDADGNDDDGVTMLTTLRRASQSYSGSFLVSASQAGYIDAWFDFNSNGRFEHPQEHYNGGVSRQVNAGFSSLPLTIPAGLTAAGRVGARFRISPTGNLTPGGEASGGEVEDYYLSVDADSVPRWCVRFPVITVTINIEITITAQATLVQNQQGVLLNDGNQSIAPLDIIAGPLNDILQLHAIQPRREVTFQGGAGSDTLSFDQAGGVLDLSSGFIKTDSIEQLSLANGTSQTVQLPAQLPLLTPSLTSELFITADWQDTVVIDPAWRVQAPIWSSQGFAHRLTSSRNSISLKNASMWTNPMNGQDVNGDGQVTPIDALLIINSINQKQTLRAPTSQADVSNWVYLDPNRSSSVEPLDALLVINAINAKGS